MVEAQIVYSTSHDPAFPPSAMLDGRPDTFWVSSGLYPQTVVVTLPGLTSVTSLSLWAYNVRKVVLARSVKNQPTDFEDVTEKELPHDEGKIQESVLSSDQVTATHLRITIAEGHDHFCSVYKMSVVGSAAGQGGQKSEVTAVVNNKPAPPPEQSSPPVVRQKSPRKVKPVSDPLTMKPDPDDDVGWAAPEYLEEDGDLPGTEFHAM